MIAIIIDIILVRLTFAVVVASHPGYACNIVEQITSTCLLVVLLLPFFLILAVIVVTLLIVLHYFATSLTITAGIFL